MKTIAFVALVCCVLTCRESAAQSFFYGPPGSEFGDYYGSSFGNGIGFGYGIGVGVSPNLLNSSITDTYIPPFQELCDSNPSFITRGVGTSATNSVLQDFPKKKTKVATTKKSATKVTPAKAKLAKQSAVK
jgi:hypothetical protein